MQKVKSNFCPVPKWELAPNWSYLEWEQTLNKVTLFTMGVHENRWVVRDGKGRIFGPFSTERLYKLIAKTVFVGNEQIAVFPDGEFQSISKVPEFYDHLLEALAKEQNALSEEERRQELTHHQEPVATKTASGPTSPPRQTQEVVNRAVREKKTGTSTQKNIHKEPEESKDQGVQQSQMTDTEKESQVIELKSQKEIKSKNEKKSIFFILVLLALGAAAYVVLDQQNKKSEDIQGMVALQYPKIKREKISEAEGKHKLAQSMQLFYSDTFKGYYRAQNQLVELLESGVQSVEAMSLLCLTHRELWPYANQDSNDLMTLSRMAQMSSQKDPVGVSGATCRAVQQLLGGQFDGAVSLVDTVLNDHPDAAIFYEFKGTILTSRGDRVSAKGYIDKAEQLLPKWLKLPVTKADLLIREGDYGGAAQILRGIIKINPNHAVAQVFLGEIEYFSFKHPKDGIELVKSALSTDRMPKAIEARAWVLIAIQKERDQKTEEAIQASTKAFSLDPTNISAKEILKRLGGKDSAIALGAADRELVALGEEYIKKGNYFAAQAEFKSAFELNPKNGRAAMLAGKSLWELNQTLDAIAWTKKAVAADPSLVPAYVQLAEYLAYRYDFKGAGEALSKAQKIAPQSYQVLTGYAAVELKRQNYKGAAEMAQRSLKLYDTDVETHNILGEALLGVGDDKKAFETMARAVSLDGNNKQAQSLYAEVLAKYQGVDAAAEYLKNLINTYPQENGFRLALGKIYLKDERLTLAIEALAQATQLDEKSKEGFIFLGHAYQKNNEPRQALKAYLTAAGLDPADVRPVFMAGELYLTTRNLQKAKEQFEQVDRINPLYPRTHYFLGKTALLMGQNDQALQHANLEKRNNPYLADGYILAGDVQMSRREYNKAAGEYQRAASIQNNATIYVYLARAYRLAENYQVAETLLGKAIKLEDGNAEIYKEQGALAEAKGEATDAKISYGKYLELAPNAADRSVVEQRIKALGGN